MGILQLRKLLWLGFILLFAAHVAPGANPLLPRLQDLLKTRRFEQLPGLFSDASYNVLSAYFCEAVDLRLAEEKDGRVTGYVKFPKHAEIVRLEFKSRHRRLFDLEFTRIMHPMAYIRGFKTVVLHDGIIERGDARFQMQGGTALVAEPFGRLLLFSGRGRFRAAPADTEERLTLEKQTGEAVMDTPFKELVLLMDKPYEKNAATAEGPGVIGENHQKLLEQFNRQFGIFVPGFNEYWYPRFSDTLNMAIFADRNGSFYHYQYNPSFVPDTTLVEMPRSRYLLSYNREAGMKMSFYAPDRMRKLQLNLYINPASRFIWGNSLLLFEKEAELLRFRLNPTLKVHAVHSWGNQGTQVFSPGGVTRYLRGGRMSKVMIQYSGRIKPLADQVSPGGEDLLDDPRRRWDPYILWNRDAYFYPGPEFHGFQEVAAEVSVPSRFRCLVSGRLVKETEDHGRRKLLFKTPSTKGLGLVCGDFVPRLRVAGIVPVQVYAASDLVLQRQIEVADIQPAMEFLVQAFGPLTSPEVNLVLRRWHRYGGISNQGLVVMNVPGPRENLRETTRRRIMRNRPAIITRLYRDSLIHELAHQWWGGEVSWDSYRDIWITEGLAQFATLFFHRRHLSERAFAAAVRRMKRWVFRHSDAGPPVYGLRIANLTGDLETMQSVVYNRSALAFAMLTEILGEEELYLRLRDIIAGHRYHSLTSSRFMALLSAGEPMLQKFFAGWILSRRLPKVSSLTRSQGSEALVELRQDGDFVIPLTVKVVTTAGISHYPVILKTRKLERRWRESAPVRAVEVSAAFAPVKLD